jgi:hypothetical protein
MLCAPVFKPEIGPELKNCIHATQQVFVIGTLFLLFRISAWCGMLLVTLCTLSCGIRATFLQH